MHLWQNVSAHETMEIFFGVFVMWLLVLIDIGIGKLREQLKSLNDVAEQLASLNDVAEEFRKMGRPKGGK
jgi:hypothetical protein